MSYHVIMLTSNCLQTEAQMRDEHHTTT